MEFKMQGFTERQLELIRLCGYMNRGCKTFSTNVSNQGWCSPKQEMVMENMVKRNILPPRYSSYKDDTKDEPFDPWHGVDPDEYGILEPF